MVLFCKEKCAVQMNGGSVRALAGKGLHVFQKESWLRGSRELHFQACLGCLPCPPPLPVLLGLPLSPALLPFKTAPGGGLGKEGREGVGTARAHQSQDPFPDEHNITRNWVF